MQQLTRPPPAGYHDPTSVAEPSRIYTTHLDLNLSVDFENEVLSGFVTLTLSTIDPTVTHILLDARDLNVSKVECSYSKNSLSFTILKDYWPTGDKLAVELPPITFDVRKITIFYSAKGRGHPAGGAIDWDQGRDGKYPFMFTQAQAIHARSFIPCQDTPSVKCTYNATITVLPPYQNLTALMSAVYDGKYGSKHIFTQRTAIPSYLIAMAVGELEGRKISDRCTVWAQPAVVEKAKWEFEQVELFLKSAEKLAGKYVWGVYDLLVLPSSFPYGGMENACLTFLTPSLLSGDRTLVNVVAHEIAHSWAGNLVTSRDFRHFWLNEGFTVKLERRILRDVYGKEREGLDAHGGLEDLNKYIAKMGEDHPYTCLVTSLKEGGDPDDNFSIVPYEKGFCLLSYLEYLIDGDKESCGGYNFDDFMWEFFKRFAHQTITTEDFLTMFAAKFPEISKMVDWDTWLYSPGYCPEIAPIDRTLVTAASDLAEDWKIQMRKAKFEESPAEYLFDHFAKQSEAVREWDAKQKQLFLAEVVKRIPREEAGKSWTEEMCGVFEKLYRVDSETNSEIKMQWCLIGIRAYRKKSVKMTAEFLRNIGRMKFVRPLYAELTSTYPGKKYATDLFLKLRDTYHDICAKMVARDLGIE